MKPPPSLLSRRKMLATGGIGSWCLMLQYLPAHLESGTPWLLKGLELPPSDAKAGRS